MHWSTFPAEIHHNCCRKWVAFHKWPTIAESRETVYRGMKFQCAIIGRFEGFLKAIQESTANFTKHAPGTMIRLTCILGLTHARIRMQCFSSAKIYHQQFCLKNYDKLCLSWFWLARFLCPGCIAFFTPFCKRPKGKFSVFHRVNRRHSYALSPAHGPRTPIEWKLD